MRVIETQKAQKPKQFTGRTQDHGDAGTQTVRMRQLIDDAGERHKRLRRETLVAGLNDRDTHKPLSSDELAAAADRILEGSHEVYSSKDVDAADPEDDMHDMPDVPEHAISEAELGVTSRREIAKAMARRATLDPHEDDDFGDDDYHPAMHVTTRP